MPKYVDNTGEKFQANRDTFMISDKLIYVKNRESELESEVSHGFHSGKHYLFRFLCFCRKRINT